GHLPHPAPGIGGHRRLRGVGVGVRHGPSGARGSHQDHARPAGHRRTGLPTARRARPGRAPVATVPDVRLAGRAGGFRGVHQERAARVAGDRQPRVADAGANAGRYGDSRLARGVRRRGRRDDEVPGGGPRDDGRLARGALAADVLGRPDPDLRLWDQARVAAGRRRGWPPGPDHARRCPRPARGGGAGPDHEVEHAGGFGPGVRPHGQGEGAPRGRRRLQARAAERDDPGAHVGGDTVRGAARRVGDRRVGLRPSGRRPARRRGHRGAGLSRGAGRRAPLRDRVRGREPHRRRALLGARPEDLAAV
ncbi:MAG: Dipeptide transport system permease protein DppB, partial [uncultured Rubrobacteraceae bacterium]